MKAGGVLSPAQPTQAQREPLARHTWKPVVAHECVDMDHWAHQVGSSGGKDMYGLFGDSTTAF